MNKITILLTITLFYLSASSALAQKPNYTGTWVLNFEKSKLEDKSDGLTGSVFIIKQKGDKFKLTRYHVFGEKKNKISFTMTANGKTRRVKLLFKGKLEWRQTDLVASLWRKNFSNIVTYSFGKNEHELIADEVFKGLSNDYHNIWVFDKQQ